jgi:cytochrome c oxidase subunit IV
MLLTAPQVALAIHASTNDEKEKVIQTMRPAEMNKESRTGLGLLIFAILVVLTLAEYLMVLVIDRGNLPWMIIMNIVDAGLILYFFMHISQLWRQE